MTTNAGMLASLLVLTAAIVVGCTGGPGSSAAPSRALPTASAPGTTPAPVPTGTPPGSTNEVTSAAQAAALVFASDPRWAQMVPLRADMIGQSSWYEAFEDGDGFGVNITVGQGDCQAGCIEQHVWRYHVDRDGTVELVGDDGEPVDVQPGVGGEGNVRVVVQLTAGPVCPVEQVPADPNCAARAVANADVTIFDADGNEIATAKSDDEGNVAFDVAAGAYYVVPATVEGVMGTPEAQAFAALGGDQVGLLFGYDTGIR